MSDAAAALLAAPNPFADNVARLETSAPLPPDVASLHGAVRAELRRAIDALGAGGAQMLLVKGDPGMGKTHELLCLQREAQRARRGFYFVDIPPLKDAGGAFRHLLRHFAQGLLAQKQLMRLLWEALRRVATSLREQTWRDGDESVTARLDLVLVGAEHFVDSFASMIAGDPKLGDLLYKRGRGLLPLAGLSPELGRVLCKLPDASLQPAITEWLRGAELPEEDLALLGVKSWLDTEARCFEVLQALVKLSPNPVVLGFDQLESTSGLLGTAGAVALFTALMEVYQQMPVCIVLMCQTQHWGQLRADLPKAAIDRVRDLGSLERPTAEQAARLVEERLAPVWRAAEATPGYATFPFPRAWLDGWVARARPTVRDLFLHCAERVDEMRRAGAVEDLGAEAAASPRPPPAAEVLSRAHERVAAEVEPARRPALATPAQRQERLRSALELILGAAASWSRTLNGARVIAVDAPARPVRGARAPILVTLDAGGGPRRIAIEVDGDKPSTIHYPLKRLLRHVADGDAHAAILLREAAAPLDVVGQAGKQYLAELELHGGVVWLADDEVRRMVAADLLVDAVSAGEIQLGARVADREDALVYLVERDDLGRVMAPVLGRVLPGSDSADLDARLHALIAGQAGIVTVERAAEMLGVAPAALEAAVDRLVEGKKMMVQKGREGRRLLVKLR